MWVDSMEIEHWVYLIIYGGNLLLIIIAVLMPSHDRQ